MIYENRAYYDLGNQDKLHIKIKDVSGNVVARFIININNPKQLVEAFMFLVEKYGINIDELYKEIQKIRKRNNPFFNQEGLGEDSPFHA